MLVADPKKAADILGNALSFAAIVADAGSSVDIQDINTLMF